MKILSDPKQHRGHGSPSDSSSAPSVETAASTFLEQLVQLDAMTLASRGFPIAVMGKTGTTNEFRDAIFVGSTYGPDGITAAVRIGFADNRSLDREKPGEG